MSPEGWGGLSPLLLRDAKRGGAEEGRDSDGHPGPRSASSSLTFLYNLICKPFFHYAKIHIEAEIE